jgi:tetratricopeptide (TPR) repeat protein
VWLLALAIGSASPLACRKAPAAKVRSVWHTEQTRLMQSRVELDLKPSDTEPIYIATETLPLLALKNGTAGHTYRVSCEWVLIPKHHTGESASTPRHEELEVTVPSASPSGLTLAHVYTLFGGDELRVSVAETGSAAALRRFVIKPPAPQAPWAHANEEEWIVASTTRDVAEMLHYARHHALPAPSERIASVQPAPATAQTPAYSVLLGQSFNLPAPIVLDFSDHIWSPRAYAGVAEAVIRSLGLQPVSGSGPGALPAILKDPQSAVLERESQRVSRRLEEFILDPDAHDQAALVLGGLALRDTADSFSDVRHLLCRMAAHMAVARALRGARSAPIADYSDAVLLTLVGRQKDALEKIDVLQKAGGPAGGAALLTALRIRNTGDWRILRQPARASLLERLEHFRALKKGLGHPQALTFFQSLKPEPISDWGRITFDGTPSIEAGNVFMGLLTSLELSDAGATWEAYHGSASDAGAVGEQLNTRPGRLLALRDGATKPRVIDWGTWAHFFQRNLVFESDAVWSFLHRSLGVPDEARAFLGRMMAPLSRLDLAAAQIATLVRAEQLVPGDAGERQKTRREACARLAAVASAAPEMLTLRTWQWANTSCAEEEKQVAAPAGWFVPLVPAGTALLDATRFAEISKLPNAPAIQDAVHQRAPFEMRFARAIHERQPAPSLEQGAALLGPLAEYNAFAMLMLARAHPEAVPQTRALYERASALTPDVSLEYGAYLVDIDQEDAAIAAYEKAIARAGDRVGVSAHMLWLIGRYCDKGQIQKARRAAEEAASVYSGRGLQAMGYFMERLGRYDDAEEWYKKVADRYKDQGSLDEFYVRHEHRTGDPRFHSQAAAALQRVFPGGLQKVTLAELKLPPPMRGAVKITGKFQRSTRFGMQKDDVVVAVNGYRVSNDPQYDCLWTFNDDGEGTVIVWRKDHYLEIKRRLPRARYAPVSNAL